MNILNSKKEIILELPSIDRTALLKKISAIGSGATIIFLIAVIATMSILIFNKVEEIKGGSKATIVYKKSEVADLEGPQKLKVNF